MSGNKTLSQLLFRMTALLAILLPGLTTSGLHAQESLLVYEGISPSPGSEITSFDFTLKFDLSKVIAEYGSGDYGVGWTGYHNDKRPEKEKSITIYKGNPSDGIVVGRVCDANYNGGSANFIPSSDVNIRIDGAIPEEGVTYTMIICNEFKTFVNGSGVPITNSIFDCFTTPITYTFVGGSASGEKLSITECSLQNGASVEKVEEVSFSFNMPVAINASNPLVITKDDETYASSVDAILSADKTTVTYKFDNVPLLLNQSYVISLPKGAVSSASNTSETNDRFNIPVTGTYVNHFMLKSSIPASDQSSVFTNIEGIFEMPDGLQVYKKTDYALNLTAYLYKEQVDEHNLIGSLEGVYNSDKNGVVWTNSYTLEPESSYILYKPKGEFRAYNPATDKFSTEWYNGEVNIVLKTPSVAEAGFAPMEFDTPIIGKHGVSTVELNCDQPIESLSTIEIPLKGFDYYLDGKRQILFYSHEALNTGYIYDITSGEPVLVKEFSNSLQKRENPSRYYMVISASISENFFAGHRYRIVIPEDTYTISDKVFKNYIFNKDIVYEFEGGTPDKVELISCSLEDGSARTSLSSVAYEFKGTYKLKEEASATFKAPNFNATVPVSVSYSGSNTRLLVNCCSSATGESYTMQDGKEYSVTLPAGTIYYEADPTLVNEEIVSTFTGKVASAQTVIEPEFVNLDVTVSGLSTISLSAVKGQSVTVRLTPNDDWKVSSLTRNGDDVKPFFASGRYITPKLTEDTSIVAEVAYAGQWAVETSSNVWEIESGKIRVFAENGKIVVIGVTTASDIRVYGLNGILIHSARVDAGNDRIELTLASGQTYIVLVDGLAAKLQL